MKLDFCRQILENLQISNFMKIRPVGSELFHAYEQADVAKLILVFRSFAKMPRNYYD
jgi:hypothetical protein